MTLLFSLVTIALIGMVGIAIINALTFPRLDDSRQPVDLPFVSVLIPARNEATQIGQTIRKLLDQDYPHFEVILLDDQSDDQTVAVAKSAATGDSRLRVVNGAPLPSGWVGKNWACQQLAQAAQGDWLVFTDADVAWSPTALRAAVAEMNRTEADLLTVWPTQRTETWGERLVVPLVSLVLLGYLPLFMVHHTPWSLFAAANGQCLAFRRRAYETMGGHATVRDEVLEDVTLARRLKQAGFRLRMADGAGLITCRMYQSWSEVRDGYAKNILAGYGHSVLGLGLASIFHWLVFLAPWLWLGLGWLDNTPAGWPIWPLILIGLGVGLRALTAAVSRQRLLDALLMPVSVLLVSLIAGQAIWWQWRYGGPRWKGRTISRKPAAREVTHG